MFIDKTYKKASKHNNDQPFVRFVTGSSKDLFFDHIYSSLPINEQVGIHQICKSFVNLYKIDTHLHTRRLEYFLPFVERIYLAGEDLFKINNISLENLLSCYCSNKLDFFDKNCLLNGLMMSTIYSNKQYSVDTMYIVCMEKIYSNQKEINNIFLSGLVNLNEHAIVFKIEGSSLLKDFTLTILSLLNKDQLICFQKIIEEKKKINVAGCSHYLTLLEEKDISIEYNEHFTKINNQAQEYRQVLESKKKSKKNNTLPISHKS